MCLGRRVQQLIHEGLDSFAQLLFIPVTVQIRRLLAQPAPQSLHRHQSGAVGRQMHRPDSQFLRLFTYRLCLVIADVVQISTSSACGWLARSASSIWLVVSPLAYAAV